VQAITYDSRETGYLVRFAGVLRAHLWLAALVLFYLAAAYLVAGYHGLTQGLSLSRYVLVVPQMTAIYLLFFALLYLVYVMVVIRPARLIRYLVTDIQENWLITERFLGGFVVVLILQLFFSIFTSMKAMIPVIHPFSWDTTLAEWDRMLHGGVDPWALMHPLVGHPLVTTVINFLYQCWLYILYGVLVWQAFALNDQRLRLQFFLTLVATWALLGNLAATLLSSAGPVYFGRVTGLEDPFGPLMGYLRAANETSPVWALEIHDRLWDTYTANTDQLGKGISAMPSIHVATSVLFALTTWRFSRRLGVVLWLYAVAILVGSVHLAWHYALDGYLAAVATCLLWIGVGWLTAGPDASGTRGPIAVGRSDEVSGTGG
jgi:hypothetical protein